MGSTRAEVAASNTFTSGLGAVTLKGAVTVDPSTLGRSCCKASLEFFFAGLRSCYGLGTPNHVLTLAAARCARTTKVLIQAQIAGAMTSTYCFQFTIHAGRSV